MKQSSISFKLFGIVIIGGACLFASLFMLGIVNEREYRFAEAKREIASKWGERQVIAGPMIIVSDPLKNTDTYILPETLHYEAVLEPEVRSRGIFKSIIYTSNVKISGEFLRSDFERLAVQNGKPAIFSVAITDTRGIEKQFSLSWDGGVYAFNPGPGRALENSSGLHTSIPLNSSSAKIPISFELQLKGNEGVSIAPVGKETTLAISSTWPTPKFVGAFLPSDRVVSSSGFESTWNISSFGRSYPQSWQNGEIRFQELIDSSAGVDLHQQIDTYDMVQRSVKYAILFIIVTFATFFLFDVLTKVRIHPIQYILIGSALALFYLLLLSLSEQIGFFLAYLLATGMISLLITSYSAFVLKAKGKALQILALLLALYGYLYFTLNLEDYALLFGSLLLFLILGIIMYTTRNLDWFAIGKQKEESLK